MYEIINDQTLTEDEKCKAIEILVMEDPSSITKRFFDLTPLHNAVSLNLFKVTKLLLELGSPVNELDYNQQTPLHLAAELGCDKIILLLGYHNCDFNSVDSSKESALHKAVRFNHPLCVKNLLQVSKYQIDKTLCNKDGYTAEDLLRQLKNIKSQCALAEAFNTLPDLFKRTPLQLAIINCLPDLIQLHLNSDAPINEQDSEGRTALHLATLCGYSNILLQLSYHDKINMNAVDKDGNTALHLCITAELSNSERSKCVKTLVSSMHPVNKNIKNKSGLTAAELIQYKGKAEEEELLKALFSTQLANSLNEAFEKELFNLEQGAHDDNYVIYLKKHYNDLDVSIKALTTEKEYTRRNSEGSNHKLFKRSQSTLRKSSIYSSDNSADLTNAQEKIIFPATSFTNNDKKNAGKEKTIEEACKKNDVAMVLNIIQNAKTDDALLPLMQEFNKFIRKHHNLQTGIFLHTVINELQSQLATHELQPLLSTTLKNLIQTSLHRKLLADGLKKTCTLREINKLTQKTFSTITDQPESIKLLTVLTKLCSGEIVKNTNNVLIDLNSIRTTSLGLLDFVEPDEIISLLIKLKPSFSPIQCLLSHFIVFTLMQLYDVYGYDPIKSPFAKQLNVYISTCCDTITADFVTQYIKCVPAIRTTSLQIEGVNSILIHDTNPKKESIEDVFAECMNQSSINLKHNKSMLHPIEYLAREFNIINAKFYQNCLLQEFRRECWNAEDKHQLHTRLFEHINVTNKMKEFIKKTIWSYSNPQKQAQAISIFILIARESLHYQYGSDMMTIAVILGVLASNDRLKDAFALIDKNILTIYNSLSKLINPSANFKDYRNFLTANRRAFHLLSVLCKDKVLLYELNKLHDNAVVLGQLYQPFISIKKMLHHVSLNSQSDLLDRLLHLKIDEEIKMNTETQKEELPQYIESSLNKSFSEKERTRKGFSLYNTLSASKDSSPRKEPSPRKESSSYTDSSPGRKSSQRKKISSPKEISPHKEVHSYQQCSLKIERSSTIELSPEKELLPPNYSNSLSLFSSSPSHVNQVGLQMEKTRNI